MMIPDASPKPEPCATPSDQPRAFEALALPHLAHLYKLAARLVGHTQDAEDLVHETYVKGLRAFPMLRDRGRIRGWLSRILARLAIDRHRQHSPEIAVGDLQELDRFSLYDLIWDEDPFPYSETLHRDFLDQFPDDEVRAALLRLPDAFRIPLVLLYAEELSYRELAETIGCPVGTIMSRLHRARKILERELWECARRRGLVRGQGL
jgi:RNA polymerase sigma-70 factor (ECF subfamily)